MITKPLLIAITVLASLLGLASYGLYKQVQKNGELSVEIDLKDAQIKSGEDLIAKERKEAREVSMRAQQFYEQRAKDDEELEKLRTCYADKSCWPRVRIKATCSVPSATADTGTPEEASAELGEYAGQNLLRLRSEINEVLTTYNAMQAELLARSNPDYCQPR